MRVLVTGGSSLLGKALYETSSKCDLAMTWFTNNINLPSYQLDICDQSQVAYVFDRVKPDVVIHCAAIGSVDFAEKDYSAAQWVNVTGIENLLQAASGAKFVYISSNAVFDGNNPPYSETSERNPINNYGRLKRDAEDLVMTYSDWMIVRPFLLYGWPWPNGRQNWMTTIEEKLSAGGRVSLVDDIYWQPTSVMDMARAIWRLIDISHNEIYHVAGPDRITLFEFGKLVARRFGLDSRLLEPVSHTKFNAMAPRPIDTTYDLSKATAAGISCKPVKEGLREC